MNTDPHRPFRPRGTRIMALGLAVIVPVVLVGTGLAVRAGIWDLAGFLTLGLLVSWILWRMGSVRAVPDAAGLVVRNVFSTTALSWAQIVSLRFGDRPWPQLDLTDGDTLAVMGIQRSDGAFAQAEARRLAGLIEDYEAGLPDD